MLPKFYFYGVKIEPNQGQTFDWNIVLNAITTETTSHTPHYEDIVNYKISIRIHQKKDVSGGKLYFGYILIGEDDTEYRIERNCDFSELDVEDDEVLFNMNKGRLYCMFFVKDDGSLTLMLEKIYFNINISAILNYFKKRYNTLIAEIKSKTILGKDLIATIKNIKDNKVKVCDIYFKKVAVEDRIREFGYAEDEMASLLSKGIRANMVLHFDEPQTVEEFFKTLTKRDTFEDALDVDFGSFLRTLSFNTDNDVTAKIDMLDKLICFTLALDKIHYTDSQLYTEMERFFLEKRDKIVV